MSTWRVTLSITAGPVVTAVVISNDTDLVEPIRIVVQELEKPVTILYPDKLSVAKPLKAVASQTPSS